MINYIEARCTARGVARVDLMQNPVTTPREFFDRVLTPSVEALRWNPGDVRLAFEASTHLHSLRERVFKAGLVPSVGKDQFFADVNDRCPAQRSVRILAGNAKHWPPKDVPKLDVGITAMPTPTICGVEDVAETMRMHVIARAEDGQKTWPVPAILEAFDWWKREFETNGW